MWTFTRLAFLFCYFRFGRSSESNVNNPKGNFPCCCFFFYLKQKQNRPMEKPFDSAEGRCDHPSWFLPFYFFFGRALCLFASKIVFPPVYDWIIHSAIFMRRLQRTATTYTQALKRHRPDGPVLLCGYLYQNGPCPAPLHIGPNNAACVIWGGPNSFFILSQSSQTSVSYRRPPYRGAQMHFHSDPIWIHSFKNRFINNGTNKNK